MTRSEYLKMHKHLRRVRGKASARICVDCKVPARDWSLQKNSDPKDIASYVPRCRSCHAKYDNVKPPVRKGDKLSAETRAKMSAARMGKKRGPYRSKAEAQA